MIKVSVINKIEFPEITLIDDLEHIAKNIIMPDIIAGIDNGMAITGGQLPFNEEATITRKGHNRQLIDTGELRSSFFYEVRGKNKVIVSIAGDRKKIGGYLQIDGIKTKFGLKFYRFFGISKDANDRLIVYLRNKIKELASANA